MTVLRCITLTLALFTLVPASQVLADPGDRSCGDCSCADTECLTIGWVETESGYRWEESFWESTCIMANWECSKWVEEGGEGGPN